VAPKKHQAMSEDEDMIAWQDVLDSISGGRRDRLSCPFCRKGTLKVDDLPRGVRIHCPECKKYIEGSLGQEEA
jgi:hypothetical protein